MSMSKKDFIALADTIREHNRLATAEHKRHRLEGAVPFDSQHLVTLMQFCESQNHRFLRGRWLAYIAGECGPNGGAVKKAV